jgi:hypothetical protein
VLSSHSVLNVCFGKVENMILLCDMDVKFVFRPSLNRSPLNAPGLPKPIIRSEAYNLPHVAVSPCALISPPNKRTEERTPVCGSEFTVKVADQGGFYIVSPRLNVKIWVLTDCLRDA